MCFLPSGSSVVAVQTTEGKDHLGFQHCNPLEYTHSRHMYLLLLVCDPYRSTLSSCSLSHTALSQGASCYSGNSSLPFNPYGGDTALGTWKRVSWSLFLPYMMRRGLLFKGFCHPVPDVNPYLWWALSLVIPVWWLSIRSMKFTHTCLAEFLLLDQNFSLVSGQDVILSPIPIWTRLWGLYLFRPSCWRILVWFTYHNHRFLWNTRTGCMSLMSSLLLDPTLSSPLITLWIQVAPSIKSNKLWCQAKLELLPVSLLDKMSVSKCIYYFFSHPAPFGFHALTLPENIIEMLPLRELISVLQLFILASVQLLMLLWKWSSLFLLWELQLWILLPLCRVLNGDGEQHECHLQYWYIIKYNIFLRPEDTMLRIFQKLFFKTT